MTGRRRMVLAGALMLGAAGLVPARTASAGTQAVFDVTDFGAIGNGVADDSQAFRDAIAAADAASGTNTVLVPAGTYALDRSDNSQNGIIRMLGVTNVDIVGQGAASIVKWMPRNWSTGSDPHLFFCDGCSFVSFSNLAVDGANGEPGFSGQEQMHALQFRNSADVTVDGVEFTDTFGDGVGLIGDEGGITEDVAVTDSTFLSSHRSGIGVQGGTRRMQFLRNHFENGNDQDIDFEPTGSAQGRPGPEDALIQFNTSVRSCPPTGQCTTAVTIGGQLATNRGKRIQFLDNVIPGALQLLHSEDVTIERNTLSGVANEGAPVLNILGQTAGLVVRDNTIEGRRPNVPVVQVQSSSGGTPEDVTIEHNRIRQLAAGGGVVVRHATGAIAVRDNEEISGVGTGNAEPEDVGVYFTLPVGDGLTRPAADLSGNDVSGFADAGIQLHNVAGAKFSTVTTCGETVDSTPIGIDYLLDSADSLGEGIVCDNVYGSGVTTKVRTDHVTHFRGTGSPEGVVAAPVGSDFVRTDEADRVYNKLSGSGTATGWVAS